MAPPRKMKAVADPLPVAPADTARVPEDKPRLGTMNYARKFRDGPTGGYAAPGMPVTTRLKPATPAKTSMPLAKYPGGTKKISAGKDVERATPSKKEALPQKPLSPFSQVEDGSEDPNLGPDMPSAPVAESPKIFVPHSVAMSLPKSRDAGPKTPKDYKEAAAVIRSDKALYKQYKDGVASGKAFSLSVGGKTFKYAATAQGTKQQQAYATATSQWDGQGDPYEEYKANMPKGPTRAAALGKAASDLVDAGQEPLPKKMKGKRA